MRSVMRAHSRQGKPHLQSGALLMTVDRDDAAQLSGAVTDGCQTGPLAGSRSAGTVITDLQDQRSVADAETYVAPGRPRVTCHVGQCFRADAKRGDLDGRAQGRE